MTNLKSRVNALERQVEAAAGCRTCAEQAVVGVRIKDGRIVDLPDWIDSEGRCRGCMTYIKLVDAKALEML